MKHPLAVREALARFPRSTQRFWTWLTGLTHRGEPLRSPWTALQHLLAFVTVATIAFAISTWYMQKLFDIARQMLA